MTHAPTLYITRHARRALRLSWRALLANKAHEYIVKARGQRIKGQGMIGADPETVAAGFESLSQDGFAEYNLPQQWVERRTIPGALDGRVPLHNAVVLDLGCGPGTSTDVLCYLGNPSWRIIGYE